jgi:hypothetical protein
MDTRMQAACRQSEYGEEDVNRPFYAIGVLLAFLAVSMLAVGSASRPRKTARRGQSLPAVATSQADGAPLTNRDTSASRGAIYVISLPAASDEATSNEAAYAEGCGLDRATGKTYPLSVTIEEAVEVLPADPTKSDLLGAEEVSSPMSPVTICLAPQPSLPVTTAIADCQSHYDAQYDRVVYGPVSGGETDGTLEASVFASEDECLDLMRQLLREDSQVTSPEAAKASAKKSDLQRPDAQFQSSLHDGPSSLSRFATLLSLLHGTIEQASAFQFDSAAGWLVRLISWTMPEVAIELVRTAPVSGG